MARGLNPLEPDSVDKLLSKYNFVLKDVISNYSRAIAQRQNNAIDEDKVDEKI